jgi:4-amino-4-deoxy-L-arabinose transferase-like glycosyltransferase
MAAVGAVAGLIQALFIHATSRRVTASPGAGYIARQADLVVRGWWFVDPTRVTGHHGFVPTALHPPLATLVFAIGDAASMIGRTPHSVLLAILFVVSVEVAGVTVRDLAGAGAGILAALAFATFPFLWVNPATLGPETIVVAVTTLLLYCSVRFWNQPSVQNAAAVGFSLGLAALTRTDLIALVILVGLPLALLVKNTTWSRRLFFLGVIAALFALVVGPWVARNQIVIGHSAVISEDYGPVLAGANCNATFSGSLEGWWSAACVRGVPHSRGSGSGSGSETRATSNEVHAAHIYVDAHLGSAVGVAAVRLGRLWNVYRPLQGVTLETAVGRPAWVSRLGLWYFYVLVPVAVCGALLLRRRRVLLFPFVAMIVLSSLTAVLAYGDARFALEADVALAMLAGVALDAVLRAAWAFSMGSGGRHSAGRRSAAVE